MTRLSVVVSLVLLLVVGAGYLLFCSRSTPDLYEPVGMSFQGGAKDLEHSVVVPTLDTPMPKGKNVIWCSSFQICWNRLKEGVFKGPIEVTNAEELSQRLNTAPQSEGDLAPGSFYAAAGFTKDGIVDRIKEQMSARFQMTPDLPDTGDDAAIVAYAFLQANVKFKLPFFENTKEFLFTNSSGEQQPVTSFGIRKEDDYAYERLRRQVNVLYDNFDEASRGGKKAPFPEFIVDPCKDSSPNQIVLACVRPKDTLQATLEDVENKIALNKTSMRDHFGVNEVLLVPNMNWEIVRRFKELEGSDKRLPNGLYIDTAMQTIRFRLDRSGAELASESKVHVMPVARYFLFDRPFLVYMKKRGAKHPFFVMWVDNAELLAKPESKTPPQGK